MGKTVSAMSLLGASLMPCTVSPQCMHPTMYKIVLSTYTCGVSD